MDTSEFLDNRIKNFEIVLEKIREAKINIDVFEDIEKLYSHILEQLNTLYQYDNDVQILSHITAWRRAVLSMDAGFFEQEIMKETIFLECVIQGLLRE